VKNRGGEKKINSYIIIWGGEDPTGWDDLGYLGIKARNRGRGMLPAVRAGIETTGLGNWVCLQEDNGLSVFFSAVGKPSLCHRPTRPTSHASLTKGLSIILRCQASLTKGLSIILRSIILIRLVNKGLNSSFCTILSSNTV
jgi:hypothetical protein